MNALHAEDPRGTEDRIFDAATECFGERGFKKTSIDAVAERANVGKGTVYLYCKSKEDLLYQSVHRELRDWVADLSKLIDPRKPASEIMVEMSTADLEFTGKRPLVRDLLHGMFHHLLPEWADRFEELRTLGQRHLIEVLELGVRQGIFARDIDVSATARVLQDVQIAASLRAHRTLAIRNGAEAESVNRYLVAAMKLVMNGLFVRPAPDKP